MLEAFSMNSKDISPEISTRNSRRSNINDAAAVNNIRAINRDFMNMFADFDLRDRRSNVPLMSRPGRDEFSGIPRASLHIMTAPVLPAFPIIRAPLTGFRFGEMHGPWGRLRQPSAPIPTSPEGDEGDSPDLDDIISRWSLPPLDTRDDSSVSDEEISDDEEWEVMSYGSLPSLVTRSDSSDDEDDCSLPALQIRPDSSDDEDSIFGSRLRLTRRRMTGNAGGDDSIPPAERRADSSNSEDDSDDESEDESDSSSDESSASSDETYWEATELEMETSEYYFDNEAVIDTGSDISMSQRRINRLYGPSSIRRNLSRVRCRCLARVSNAQAWIKLRDTVRVGRAVQ